MFTLSRFKIYVAGPLFSTHERKFLKDLVNELAEGLELDTYNDFFLPHRDAGDVGIAGKTQDNVFYDDLHYLESSKAVIALLDGCDVDSGTAVEVGYAYAMKKEIYGLLTDRRKWDNTGSQVIGINNMVWGVLLQGRRIYRSVDSLIQELKKSLLK